MSNDHFAHFRDNLRRLCNWHGSQKSFAARLGISTVHLCNVINGTSMPSTKLLTQIADEAGWTLAWLLESPAIEDKKGTPCNWRTNEMKRTVDAHNALANAIAAENARLRNTLEKTLAFMTNINTADPRELAIQIRDALAAAGVDVPADVISDKLVAPLWLLDEFLGYE